MEWQPIDSAPKQTSILVLAYGEYPCWCNGCVHRDGSVHWMDYNDEYELNPTHWMPLPPPPAS